MTKLYLSNECEAGKNQLAELKKKFLERSQSDMENNRRVKRLQKLLARGMAIINYLVSYLVLGRDFDRLTLNLNWLPIINQNYNHEFIALKCLILYTT